MLLFKAILIILKYIDTNFMIDQNIAYGLVSGCSVFGMIWGLVNVFLVRFIVSILNNCQVRSVDMDDYSHLCKESAEVESQSLLGKEHHDTKPEEAREILERMKHISSLIRNVTNPLFSILNYYYIGSYYFPQIRIHLSINLRCLIFRYSLRLCRANLRNSIHNCCLRYWSLHLNLSWVSWNENRRLY